MARIPNLDVVVQQLNLPYGPPPGLAWPYQENHLIAQIAGIPGHGEIQARQRGGAPPVQEHEVPVRPEGPAPVQHQLCCPTNPEGWIPIHSLHRQKAEEAEGESTPLPTMTGIDRGQTRGIIQILKKMKNTGRKFCPGHTEWSTGLTTPN
ncbi:unnamed protein product [Prunus armeniaca]